MTVPAISYTGPFGSTFYTLQADRWSMRAVRGKRDISLKFLALDESSEAPLLLWSRARIRNKISWARIPQTGAISWLKPPALKVVRNHHRPVVVRFDDIERLHFATSRADAARAENQHAHTGPRRDAANIGGSCKGFP